MRTIPSAILCCAVLLSLHAQAGDAGGTVVSVRGGALERQASEGWEALAEGQTVQMGERLRTGAGAVAVLEYPGVGRFVMGPASEIEMGRDPRDFDTAMNRGALWMQAQPATGGHAAISTPIAVAGVRGTAFSMVFGEGEQAVCACTCEGQVEVRATDGSLLTVPRGQYVAVDAGKAVPAATTSSAPLLAQTGGVFEFCHNCHEVSAEARLKPGWR
ncbi:MAG: FecR domain-containing protein [Xanthomonadales bacterium]|nr:hypothetical protein [Xanthomonadales bacterium]MCC6594293.1 FecR domain-containing protein [Xanthomonadales bacterium]